MSRKKKKKDNRKPILCIVKGSSAIKRELKKRFEELELTGSDVIDDAHERGRTMALSSLSRYFNKDAYVVSGLSQEHILWLCVRYSIAVRLDVMSMNHNEENAIENLKKYFS